MGVEELEAQITLQGEKVKEMKTAKAEKEDVTAEVAKLLELKNQLPDDHPLKPKPKAKKEKKAAPPAAPKAKKDKKPKEAKAPAAAPAPVEGDLRAQLEAAIQQQAALGNLIKEKKEKKEDVADLVAQLKKVKQNVNALDKQVNPPEDNVLLANREELETLCTRRFFYRPAFSIYGGTAGFYTYGPPGAAAKNNLIQLWRKHFVIEDNMMEIEDTCIMPKPVLQASGHVDRFNDFMVKDTIDTEKFYRADKLLEEEMEKRMAEPGLSQEQHDELQVCFSLADAYSQEELHQQFLKYEIKAPETGNPLTEPYEFNLMYPTSIGPTGDQVGYLRPETAQGIFLNYKFCYEQNGGNIPFGIAQAGKAFRNEIAPRGGLIRQREFTQLEIEYFVKPGEKRYPKFFSRGLDELVCTLWPHEQQLSAKKPIEMKLGDAVKQGIIANETLAYFVGRMHEFLVKAGIQRKWLRFRQHLPTEMAHYACDCWDAEILISHGWTEAVGIADRSAFDLQAHADATGDKGLTAFETLAVPLKVEEVVLPNKGPGKAIGMTFKKAAKSIQAYLEALPKDQALALKEAGGGEIEVGGEKFTLEAKHVAYEVRIVDKFVEEYVPNVIEPSLGVDRVLYAIFEHAYHQRASADGGDDAKEKRHVLSFSPAMSPYMIAVFPQDPRILKTPEFGPIFSEITAACSMNGISLKPDLTSVSIGKKYSRYDELGVPLCCVIDPESLKGGGVTLRERDSVTQVRVPASAVSELALKFSLGQVDWASIQRQYVAVENSASSKVALGNSSQPAAAPAAAPQSEMEVLEAFLNSHQIESKVQAAVNHAAALKSANPIKDIIDALSKMQ